MNKVVARFAPSPTGPLHIGGVRTALYNYLFAKQNDGTLILRIEDTDSTRFVPGAEDYIIEALEWLGIHFDEGVGKGGDHGPYRQSERRDIYRKYVHRLLDEGKAYKAYDTPEELDAKRKEIDNFQYDARTRMEMKNSLTLSSDECSSLESKGVPFVVRLRIEPGEDVVVNDLIRGEVVINSSVLDDKVLYKSVDDLPTYHLANIVDDHLMEVTHVIRGEEWISSAPLHVLLYRALGWESEMPKFAHLPLLLKPEGNGKLSKRDGDRLGFPVFPLEWRSGEGSNATVSSGYRESGYLPEAVINFLALLGWNPGDDSEILSMDELIEKFDLSRCSKSGAKFDYEKGKWFNHKYIQEYDDERLTELLLPYLHDAGIECTREELSQVLPLVKERLTLLGDIVPEADFFFRAPTDYDPKAVKKRWKTQTPDIINRYVNLLEAQEDFTSIPLEEVTKSWIEENELGMGAVLNATRLALVGELRGPHLFDIMEVIGKEETLRRLRRAVSQISL